VFYSFLGSQFAQQGSGGGAWLWHLSDVCEGRSTKALLHPTAGRLTQHFADVKYQDQGVLAYELFAVITAKVLSYRRNRSGEVVALLFSCGACQQFALCCCCRMTFVAAVGSLPRFSEACVLVCKRELNTMLLAIGTPADCDLLSVHDIIRSFVCWHCMCLG
jgi:hypothetical protein